MSTVRDAYGQMGVIRATLHFAIGVPLCAMHVRKCAECRAVDRAWDE